MERPQYTIIGFDNNNVNEQINDAITFQIMNVTECYFNIGSEFYPEDRTNIITVLIIIMKLLNRLFILLRVRMDYLIILNHIKIIEHSKVVIEHMRLILEIKMII